jgi:hypothetical protein
VADVQVLKIQRLQNQVLRAIGNFDMRTWLSKFLACAISI